MNSPGSGPFGPCNGIVSDYIAGRVRKWENTCFSRGCHDHGEVEHFAQFPMCEECIAILRCIEISSETEQADLDVNNQQQLGIRQSMKLGRIRDVSQYHFC